MDLSVFASSLIETIFLPLASMADNPFPESLDFSTLVPVGCIWVVAITRSMKRDLLDSSEYVSYVPIHRLRAQAHRLLIVLDSLSQHNKVGGSLLATYFQRAVAQGLPALPVVRETWPPRTSETSTIGRVRPQTVPPRRLSLVGRFAESSARQTG